MLRRNDIETADDVRVGFLVPPRVVELLMVEELVALEGVRRVVFTDGAYIDEGAVLAGVVGNMEDDTLRVWL